MPELLLRTKTLILSLSLCLVSGILPASVQAEYGHDKQGNLYYFKFAFIDTKGNRVFDVPEKYDCEDFSDGRLLIKNDEVNSKRLCGYLNRDGKSVASGILNGRSFSEGMAEVGEYGKSSFIDTSGKVCIKGNFDSAREFHESLAAVSINKKCGFINKQGIIAVDPFFDDVSGFSEGLAAAAVQEQIGFIDRQGNWKIQPQYNYVDGFSDGLALVRNEDGEFFIDKEGKRIITLTESQRKRAFVIWRVSPSGLSAGKSNTGGHLGRCTFQNICSFAEGLAPMYSDGKYGYVDKTGKFVIPPKFDIAYPIIEGLGLVRVGKLYGYVDKRGVIAIKPKYFAAEPFSDGLAAVGVSHNRWGFIDRNGKMIVAPNFVHVNSFKEGLAKVQLDGWYNDKIEP